MRNVPANTNNRKLSMWTELSWASVDSTVHVQSTAPAFTVQEPLLEISIVQPQPQPDANDTLSLTISVTHTGASTAAAYQGTVHVHVPATYELQTSSINPGLGGLNDSTPALTIINASYFTVYFATMQNMALQALQIVYDVVVLPSARPDEDIVSNTWVDWTSTFEGYPIPGREREINSTLYPSVAAAQTTTVDEPVLGVALNRTSLEDTIDQDVNIGEEAVFRSCFTLIEGVQNVTITSTFSGGLTFINATLMHIGSRLQGVPYAKNALLPDTNANVYVIPFGVVTNVADNIEDERDEICMEVAVLVANM